MRFIRIGDHLVNVAEASYIHFGKGAHVDIVFNDRVLSGPVSGVSLFRLNMLCNDVDDEAPEVGLSESDDPPSKEEWNEAWQEAIDMCTAESLRWPAYSEAVAFLTSQVDFMRSKLID